MKYFFGKLNLFHPGDLAGRNKKRLKDFSLEVVTRFSNGAILSNRLTLFIIDPFIFSVRFRSVGFCVQTISTLQAVKHEAVRWPQGKKNNYNLKKNLPELNKEKKVLLK